MHFVLVLIPNISIFNENLGDELTIFLDNFLTK